MTDVKLWLLYNNTWNHLTEWKKSSGSFKNVTNKMCLQIYIYIYIYIYVCVCVYKEDFALNNLQWLICHKIQPNQEVKMGMINNYW